MSQSLARAGAQPPAGALLKVVGSNRLGALRGGLRGRRNVVGSLTGALGADLDGPAGDCLVRRAG